MTAPACCPKCGEKEGWQETPNILRGIAVGSMRVGIVHKRGLLRRLIPAPRAVYSCKKCGFTGKYR